MTWIVERFNDWLAGATDQTIVGTCLILAAVAGGLVAFTLKWRHDKRQP
jgi:hypothetical protein